MDTLFRHHAAPGSVVFGGSDIDAGVFRSTQTGHPFVLLSPHAVGEATLETHFHPTGRSHLDEAQMNTSHSHS